MVASGVFAGAYTLEEAYAKTDKDGLTLGGELERIVAVPGLSRDLFEQASKSLG